MDVVNAHEDKVARGKAKAMIVKIKRGAAERPKMPEISGSPQNDNDIKTETKEEIMITTLDNDTLYGIGFESDSDLKNWKIIEPSGVTGRKLK